MAKKISPQEIDFFREYYVAARTWSGLIFGRLAVGRLIPLGGESKIVLAKEPEEVNEHTYDNVLVIFKTEKGLHNWRAKHYPETIPVPQEDSKLEMLADHYALQVKSVNKKIRTEEGVVFYAPITKHKEPIPFTSLLYQRMIDEGAVLRYKSGHFTLYTDRFKKEELSNGDNFVSLLSILADRQYRLNMQKAHEASLDPNLVYISKGNPEKKQPPFILSQIM